MTCKLLCVIFIAIDLSISQNCLECLWHLINIVHASISRTQARFQQQNKILIIYYIYTNPQIKDISISFNQQDHLYQMKSDRSFRIESMGMCFQIGKYIALIFFMKKDHVCYHIVCIFAQGFFFFFFSFDWLVILLLLLKCGEIFMLNNDI